MVWGYIVVFVAAIVIAAKTIPKPQTQPPAGLDDIDVPVAEEGGEIRVLFGTRVFKGPNVVWFGDIRTVPVKKKGGKK